MTDRPSPPAGPGGPADNASRGRPSGKLLIVAVVLAMVVVVLYNLQVAKYRKAQTGQMVELLRLTTSLRAGQAIKPEDVEKVPMPAQYAGGLANCITGERADYDYAVSSTVNQPVRKGQWLLYEFTTPVQGSSPSNRIRSKWVGQTVTIDPQKSPGELLSIGDRVNVLAVMAVGSKPLSASRVIENVRVIAIAGRSFDEGQADPRRRPGGSREYRRITVEVPLDVSLQLANVLSHAQGTPWVEVCNPADAGSSGGEARINPELRNLAAVAAGGGASPRAVPPNEEP
jgi:Flp pilus assembly protein CpaB